MLVLVPVFLKLPVEYDETNSRHVMTESVALSDLPVGGLIRVPYSS